MEWSGRMSTLDLDQQLAEIAAGPHTRRSALVGAGALALAAALEPAATRPGLRRERGPRFGSLHPRRRLGRPAPDGVVLWTRLAPQPLEPAAACRRRPVEVALGGRRRTTRHARGRRARRPRVASPAARALGPRRGATGLRARPLVLVPLPRRRRGQPDRPHPHRARPRRRRRAARGSPSPRASTTSRATSPPTAHMAEEDLDLVVHLGDYIYERSDGRAPGASAPARRPEPTTLDRLPEPPRAVQDRSRPAGRARRAARGSSPGTTTRSTTTTPATSPRTLRRPERVPRAARGRLPGLLRAHAAAAAARCRAGRACSSTAA